MMWRSFAAVGDSFTEGLDDPHPTGGYRGWADLVAAALAVNTTGPDGPFRYANLAVRGRKFAGVAEEQVPAVLKMRPDLVSFAAGGNDALRRGFDGAGLAEKLDGIVASLRTGGSDVLLFRFTDISLRLPARRVVLPRVMLLNDIVTGVAGRHGAYLVDLWEDDEFHNPRLWSTDRLHLSPIGHRRVAAQVLTTLGVQPEAAWLAAADPPRRLSWSVARAADARWAAQHLAPWIRRRLTGRSSGDQVVAKRPELAPVGD
jgi:lysophospholipase L1-like esterase